MRLLAPLALLLGLAAAQFGFFEQMFGGAGAGGHEQQHQQQQQRLNPSDASLYDKRYRDCAAPPPPTVPGPSPSR